MTEPETFIWQQSDLAKLVPNCGVVVLHRNADGTPHPQLRIVAMAWRGHVFLVDGRDGKRFQTVRLEQCDPLSLVAASEAVTLVRGGSAA